MDIPVLCASKNWLSGADVWAVCVMEGVVEFMFPLVLIRVTGSWQVVRGFLQRGCVWTTPCMAWPHAGLALHTSVHARTGVLLLLPLVLEAFACRVLSCCPRPNMCGWPLVGAARGPHLQKLLHRDSAVDCATSWQKRAQRMVGVIACVFLEPSRRFAAACLLACLRLLG